MILDVSNIMSSSKCSSRTFSLPLGGWWVKRTKSTILNIQNNDFGRFEHYGELEKLVQSVLTPLGWLVGKTNKVDNIKYSKQ